MSLALSNASYLKPDVRLAQAVSQFEADLSPPMKVDFRSYREQISKDPPSPNDVMRLTAKIDRLASGKGFRRCLGPRFTNFLQAVQQFAALGDVIVGSSQNIIACGVWSLVRISLLLLVNFSTYLEKLSTLLMNVGRSAPRYQSMALLYPQSTRLQFYLFEYYVVVVSLCHKLLIFTQKSSVGKLAVSFGHSDFATYQSELEKWASAIREQVSFLMAEKVEEEARENWRFRALTTKATASASQLQKLKINQMVLASLSTYEFEKTWKQARKRGNTTLLDQNKVYQDWRDQEDSSTLVYTGKLGCGKSVLLANMVDEINLHVQNKNTAVAYFFYRHDISKSLEARTVIGSLACQFLQMIPDLDLTPTTNFLDMTRPTLDEGRILNLLQRILPVDFKAYVILDGIDDCDDDERGELIQQLGNLQGKMKLLLCISHRLESNSRLKLDLKYLTAVTSASVPDNNPDIEDFIEAELARCIESEKLILGDPIVIREIQDALHTGSKGMFLWTALQIEALCHMETDDAIRQALQNLPKDLSETFSRILSRSLETDQVYQKRVFQLVTAAQRPLTAEELREAMSVTPGDSVWQPAKLINDIFSVLACCGSLLTIDEEDQTIQFVHHSVEQFLLEANKESKMAFTMDGAKRTMSEIVLTYLNYDISDTQLSAAHSSQVIKPSAMPKIIQSTLDSSNTVSKLALRILKSRKNVDFDINKVLMETRQASGVSLIHRHDFRSYAQSYWVQHVLDLSDLDQHMHHLLFRLLKGNRVDVNHPNDLGATPISLAVMKGNEVVVKALTESDKVKYKEDGKYGLPRLLQIAAHNGAEAQVKLLLYIGQVNINWWGEPLHGTPLSLAVERGNETIVKILLETGKADVNLTSAALNRTPLSFAAQKGHTGIVKLLLDTSQVDIDSKFSHFCNGSSSREWLAKSHQTYLKARFGLHLLNSYSDMTPLSIAAKNGHEGVVKLLLETDKVDVNGKTSTAEDTPLSLAVEHGHEGVVNLLLDTRKPTMHVTGDGSCLELILAAIYGHEAIVKRLLHELENVLNVRILRAYGQSTLVVAAMYGHEAIVKLLIEQRNADVNARNTDGKPALVIAAEQGDWAMMNLLLGIKGMDISVTDNDGHSALWWAKEKKKENMVALLEPLLIGSNYNFQLHIPLF